MQKVVCFILSIAMGLSSVPAYATSAFVASLPTPGSMVDPSPAFVPVLTKGLVIHPDKPLNFDFIVDSGNDSADPAVIKAQSDRLAKYFLAAVTVPEDQLWVNLSPYEHDRVIEGELGRTVLGRDMLAQDYVLKQLTATMLHPDGAVGKRFWSEVYARAQAQFGSTDIPVDTFNKVWITPDKAEVFEKGNAVYVTQARLKVELDSDHQAMAQGGHVPYPPVSGTCGSGTCPPANTAELAKIVLREIVVPAIEQEVNEGKSFAVMRQIYHAAILAKWYREAIQNTMLADAYVGKNRVVGVMSDEKALKEQIYQRYVAAYKKGVVDLIREEPGPGPDEVLPRKYFSGGENLAIRVLDRAQSPTLLRKVTGRLLRVAVVLGLSVTGVLAGYPQAADALQELALWRSLMAMLEGGSAAQIVAYSSAVAAAIPLAKSRAVNEAWVRLRVKWLCALGTAGSRERLLEMSRDRWVVYDIEEELVARKDPGFIPLVVDMLSNKYIAARQAYLMLQAISPEKEPYAGLLRSVLVNHWMEGYGLRTQVAGILHELGWAPTGLEEKLAFYFAAEDWRAIAALGEEASPFLLQSVVPHLLHGQRWAELVSLGTPGVRALEDELAALVAMMKKPETPPTFIVARDRSTWVDKYREISAILYRPGGPIPEPVLRRKELLVIPEGGSLADGFPREFEYYDFVPADASASPDGSQVGGIDIRGLRPASASGTEEFRFNEAAVRAVLQEGFNGFAPVIQNVTHLAGPLPLPK